MLNINALFNLSNLKSFNSISGITLLFPNIYIIFKSN